MDPQEVAAHDEAVDSLNRAYQLRENHRVPISFATDEGVWLAITGHTFRSFYNDPRTHLEVQLAGQKWMCDQIVADQPRAYPERWRVAPRLWMEENEFFGCEVVYQENDYAWGKPLAGTKEEVLAKLADLDPVEAVRRGELYALYCACKELAEEMELEGRPVEIVCPVGSTHGVFTKACEIRGIGRLCEELYTDPSFVHRLLALVTEKEIGRIKAWAQLTGVEREFPSPNGWGCCDDSLQIISGELYREFVLPCHRRLYEAMTTGTRSMHLCGRAAQHYRLLHQELGISCIDGPGPFVGHAYHLADLGETLSINAQMDHVVVRSGSARGIEEMMRGMLTPGAKKPGRFRICGFILPGTPVANVRMAYEAGLQYGLIP